MMPRKSAMFGAQGSQPVVVVDPKCHNWTEGEAHADEKWHIQGMIQTDKLFGDVWRIVFRLENAHESSAQGKIQVRPGESVHVQKKTGSPNFGNQPAGTILPNVCGSL